MSSTFAQLSSDVAAMGGLDYTEEKVTSDRWAKGGLRMLNRAGAWEWLHTHTSFAFVANQYAYDLSTIASDLFRIATDTIRYGGTYLQWGAAKSIDQVLEPTWKDGSGLGTPQYAARVGNQLWVATVPNTAFVTDHPTGYFYYFRAENYTGTLYLPDEFYDCAVDSALAFGFTQEDDPRAQEMLMRVQQIHLTSMLGAKLDIGARNQMSLSRSASGQESILSDYGDGWQRGN